MEAANPLAVLDAERVLAIEQSGKPKVSQPAQFSSARNR